MIKTMRWGTTPFKEDMQAILCHQTDDVSPYWKNRLFMAYPELDRAFCEKNSWQKRKKYLTEALFKIRKEKAPLIHEKVKLTQSFWDKRAPEMTAAFSKAFGVDCTQILSLIKGRIGLNPVCPRDLDRKIFNTAFFYTPETNTNIAIHEITHFIWFDMWHRHFKDNPKNYNSPHLKWILSEIVVDSIVRHSPLFSLYTSSRKNSIAYAYFYDMKIKNRAILKTLEEFYKKEKMTDFMEKAYQYCQENEKELRQKITQAETK